jgi:hypothetical protein
VLVPLECVSRVPADPATSNQQHDKACDRVLDWVRPTTDTHSFCLFPTIHHPSLAAHMGMRTRAHRRRRRLAAATLAQHCIKPALKASGWSVSPTRINHGQHCGQGTYTVPIHAAYGLEDSVLDAVHRARNNVQIEWEDGDTHLGSDSGNTMDQDGGDVCTVGREDNSIHHHLC